MGDLSENFSGWEFACPDGCGFGTRPGDVDPKLVEVLEELRAACGGKPMTISPGGGCRCAERNRLIRRCNKRGPGWRVHGNFLGEKCPTCGSRGIQRSARNSQHLRGKAADLTIKGVLPRRVQRIAEKIKGIGGIGKYNDFTHVDTRDARVTW